MSRTRFIIIGQSQPVGVNADPAEGFIHPLTGKHDVLASGNDGGVTDMNHDRDSFKTDNMWRAFGAEWLAQTGQTSLFVNCAVPGSGMLKAANSIAYWDTAEAGNLFEASKLKAGRVDFAVSISKFSASYSETIVIFCQGETDGDKENGGTVTGAIYQARLEALMVASLAYFGASKFLVITLGIKSGASPAGWDDVRAAQQAAVAANASAEIIFSGANDPNPLVVDANKKWISGMNYRDEGTGVLVHYSGATYHAIWTKGCGKCSPLRRGRRVKGKT